MQLRDIIPNSTLAIIATATGPGCLEKADIFLRLNGDVMGQFDNLLLVFNATEEGKGYITEYQRMYKSAFKNIRIIYQMANRGHMFGTIDLDEACLQYAKEDGSRYLWKSTEDVLLSIDLFNVQVQDDMEFGYLPGFSYESLCMTASLLNDYESKWFTPQSNFFIVNVTKVESLYGDNIEEKRNIYLSLLKGKPSLKPWDVHFPDGIKFACEDMLGYRVGLLKKECLLTDKTFRNLIKHVWNHKEADPSHKNIYFKEIGVCHYHNYKEPVYHI